MKIKMNQEGCILIPKEVRQYLNINADDILNLSISTDKLVIRKQIESCIFCGAAANLVKIGEYAVCLGCIKRLEQAKVGDCFYPIKSFE